MGLNPQILLKGKLTTTSQFLIPFVKWQPSKLAIIYVMMCTNSAACWWYVCVLMPDATNK
jgi:hypothetical protein